MKASALFRIAIAAPAAILVAAGTAVACPPESEGRETPVPTIELGLSDELLELQSADGFTWLQSDPAMAVFQAEKSQNTNPFFGPGEGQQRVRIVRPSGGIAAAQTSTATRGNGQASAQARAALGQQLLRRAQAESDDPITVEGMPLKRAREVQGFRMKSPKLAATPPLPEALQDFDAMVEGRAIVVGPDGQVSEHVFSNNPQPAAAATKQKRLRHERALVEAQRQDAANQDEAIAREHAAMAGAAMPRVWVGVELAEPDASIVRYFDLEPGQSSEIAKVFEGSPAAKAGLKDHDIVVKINGAAMAGPDILREVVGASDPDQVIRLNVLRKGKTHSIDLRPELREQPAAAVPGVPLSDPVGAAPARKSTSRDLEQRMDRIERMLEKLLENDARD